LTALNVDGDVLIGSSYAYSNNSTKGFVYLPTGLVTCATNLYVGDSDPGSSGLLVLNGTQFKVGKRMEIGATGTITNTVNGVSSGIDFQGTDGNNFAIVTGGRMRVVFAGDPVDPYDLYWGLKMKGDTREFMRSLTNDASRFSLSAAGLSSTLRDQLGIYYYRPPYDFTCLGLPWAVPSVEGAVLEVR
jgi:hypothetical protein